MTDWHFIAPPNEIVEKSLGIVRCSQCGRPLTDHDSVAKGIGPVCEAREVMKSFPGHEGRPGRVGGSLPRKGAKPKSRAGAREARRKGAGVAQAVTNLVRDVLFMPKDAKVNMKKIRFSRTGKSKGKLRLTKDSPILTIGLKHLRRNRITMAELEAYMIRRGVLPTSGRH